MRRANPGASQPGQSDACQYCRWFLIWVWVNTYRYMFSGMNIHLIYQLFWCSPGVHGFDTLPYVYTWLYMCVCYVYTYEWLNTGGKRWEHFGGPVFEGHIWMFMIVCICLLYMKTAIPYFWLNHWTMNDVITTSPKDMVGMKELISWIIPTWPGWWFGTVFPIYWE
jgi:hypothetical protein